MVGIDIRESVGEIVGLFGEENWIIGEQKSVVWIRTGKCQIAINVFDV